MSENNDEEQLRVEFEKWVEEYINTNYDDLFEKFMYEKEPPPPGLIEAMKEL